MKICDLPGLRSMASLTEVDWAWAAGFYEGEGSVYQKSGARWPSAPQIHIQQVNKEPLVWLQEKFGGEIYGPRIPKNPNAQPYWAWNVNRYEEAKAFAYGILPWLSDKKRSELMQKIEFHENIKEVALNYCSKVHDKSQKRTVFGTNGGTVCLECESERKRAAYARKKEKYEISDEE